MKNILDKIKNIFTSKKRLTSSVVDPHKHWTMLLWIFLALVTLLIVFSFYLLYEVKNEQIFQVTPTIEDNSIKLKETLLNEVTESFNQKNKKEAELKANPPSFKDPSI
ncbi:MAG: hypothetical protein AAB477_00560 [Patescibacteria group bacterium]